MVQEFQASLRLVTLLAPPLYETYNSIARYLEAQLDLPVSLHVGHSLDEFARGEAEAGFLCGLLYVHLTRASPCPVELLVAPVLQGERYRDKAIYFSDVIVRSGSSARSFADLRGCVWAYNERASHSGYNLVCCSLLQRALPVDFFGRTLETGSHQQSLRLVLEGSADAAALDSHLLDVLFLQQPELTDKLRVIDMFGPSAIPPLVIALHLDSALKQRIQAILLGMHRDPRIAQELSKGRIKRFTTVSDEHYDDIRSMFASVQDALVAL